MLTICGQVKSVDRSVIQKNASAIGMQKPQHKQETDDASEEVEFDEWSLVPGRGGKGGQRINPTSSTLFNISCRYLA